MLHVGRVDKPHGLSGEVVVSLTTNREERVAPGAHLYLDGENGRELVVLTSIPFTHRYIVAFDGVFNSLEDAEGFFKEAEAGRRLGFDGKSLIHPNQIEPCHRAFAPSPAEIERAKALVAAFHGGAERFGNEMIERMHVEAAERVLERAAG